MVRKPAAADEREPSSRPRRLQLAAAAPTTRISIRMNTLLLERRVAT
jgi:hypothetical protein